MVVFVIVIFFVLLLGIKNSAKKALIKTNLENEFENKFTYLIKFFVHRYRMKLISKTRISSTYAITGEIVYCEFHLRKSLEKLNVVWTFSNKELGKQELKWEFNLNDSQPYMSEVILKEIEDFNE